MGQDHRMARADRQAIGGRTCRARPIPASHPCHRSNRLAPWRRTVDICPWKAGDGQVPRQPGQVRKEAAATSFDVGRRRSSTFFSSNRPLAAGPLLDSVDRDRSSCPPGDAPGIPPNFMSNQVEYRVLARKYRPASFDQLIGHDTLVRTLSNAFNSGRIAHAFMLTGVRGVGKTTTARIIARALNCIGPDGKRTEPTIHPCGVCEPCVSISESRNVDVQEMDAASRTGIDDVREIIEGVRYAPVAARYKVYIIDEVHMLSKQAFNGLLKTLEEPPPHVKFVFATTEIRKVPVTVLSRCQRFDLRRIESA